MDILTTLASEAEQAAAFQAVLFAWLAVDTLKHPIRRLGKDVGALVLRLLSMSIAGAIAYHIWPEGGMWGRELAAATVALATPWLHHLFVMKGADFVQALLKRFGVEVDLRGVVTGRSYKLVQTRDGKLEERPADQPSAEGERTVFQKEP